MRTYEKYKDSGIQWIGEIPGHWEVKKLKFSDEVIMGQSPSSEDYIDDENAMPFLQGNADFTDIFPLPRIFCNTANKITQENDVLLSVRAPIGAVNISNKKYGIGRGLCAIRAVNSYFKFLYYHSLLQRDELNSIGTGSTYTAIAVEDVRNSIYVCPSHSEQTAIANYLDSKTTEIDQVVADKESLVSLYEEEKKALINEAVTKGLNAKVKLKPSGIDWLGDVPEQWEVKKLKYVVTCNDEVLPESTDKDTIINYVEIGDVNLMNGIEKFTEISFGESPSRARRKTKYGDVIISTVRTYLGAIARIEDSIENLIVSTGFAVLRVQMINSLFLGFFVKSQGFIDQVISQSTGVSYPAISSTQLMNIEILVPHLEEQTAIVQYIESETANINEKINQIKQEIELLKEYRQALIFETVTGKVRVF